jgi:prevent-host-death family protein
MRTMLVSEFKAKCLAALKDVRRTRRPLLVTLRGEPLAAIHPPEHRRRAKRLGGLQGQMVIRRDLARIDSAKDWEMLQ